MECIGVLFLGIGLWTVFGVVGRELYLVSRLERFLLGHARTHTSG